MSFFICLAFVLACCLIVDGLIANHKTPPETCPPHNWERKRFPDMGDGALETPYLFCSKCKKEVF